MFTNLILFLVAYFGFLTYLSFKLSSGYDNSKVGYLVANRTAGFWESSFAIAGSWALGGALFGVVEMSYKGGAPGFLWYIVPQVIGILFFGWFSQFINANIPNGYTISDFIKTKFGKTVSGFYQICLIMGAVGLISLTTTGLTKFLTYMQFPNVSVITGIVTLGTICYALKGGLKTNLVIGSLQAFFLVSFCIVLLLFGLPNNTWELVTAGSIGTAGYTGLFDPKLMMSFGVSIGIMSLSGIMGNQCFYQKTFAQQTTNNSVKSFWLAALLWAIVPCTFGLITFIAAGAGISTTDIAYTHLLWMSSTFGPIALLAFGFLVLNATANCLDTQSNAVGSIVANDWVKDESKSVFYTRLSIIVVSILAWGISTLNLSMTAIMLAYGIFRVLLFFVTIIAVRTDLLTKIGMLVTIAIIAPLALYLNFNNATLPASLLAFIGTPLLALAVSYFSKKFNFYSKR
jgi:Na+/proline symporter